MPGNPRGAVRVAAGFAAAAILYAAIQTVEWGFLAAPIAAGLIAGYTLRGRGAAALLVGMAAGLTGWAAILAAVGAPRAAGVAAAIGGAPALAVAAAYHALTPALAAYLASGLLPAFRRAKPQGAELLSS